MSTVRALTSTFQATPSKPIFEAAPAQAAGARENSVASDFKWAKQILSGLRSVLANSTKKGTKKPLDKDQRKRLKADIDELTRLINAAKALPAGAQKKQAMKAAVKFAGFVQYWITMPNPGRDIGVG